MQATDDPSIDSSSLSLFLQFILTPGIRTIGGVLIDTAQRLIQLFEFQDNEHYSNLESLLLQLSPRPSSSSASLFSLVLNLPQLVSEASKIREILTILDLTFSENNAKTSNVLPQKELEFLLEQPLKNYVKELELNVASGVLGAALGWMKLEKEEGNREQYKLKVYKVNAFMKLDLAALNALSLFPKTNEKKGGAGVGIGEFATLVELLDRCKTQIGSRTLRRWMKQPLQKQEEIERRLDIVEILFEATSMREELALDFLRKIPDLDKLYAKFYKVHSKQRHNAGLVDCLKVYQLVGAIRAVLSALQKYAEGGARKVKNFSVFQKNFIEPMEECLRDFEKLEEMVEKAIDLEKARDGEYMIRPQFSKRLTELSQEIGKTLKEIEKVRKGAEDDLGIEVKLVESNSYTYLFEVSKKTGDAAFRSSAKKYRQISIKNNKISFNTDKLIELSSQYSDLLSTYKSEQSTVVDKILAVVSTYYPAMEKAAVIIAEIDVICNFAHISANAPTPYVRPKIGGKEINLKDARHPCLEMADRQNCVSNDCEMTPSSRLHIITGPNMSGKSTFIRQVAIVVLMAHMGCFVPCSSAEIPIIDAIITRVGASDMQLRGISTFMSEMLEAACMLKVGTMNSLIIIDELGRGTSTSEGFGLAWAIAEYIAEKVRGFCLFATHFHEMTMMEGKVEGVINYYVSAIVKSNKLTMLYKVRKGAVDRSYGLFVAEMLGFPEKIVNDARKKALELENYENFIGGYRESKMEEEEIFEEKREGDINNGSSSRKEDFIELCKNASTSQKAEVIKVVEEGRRNGESAEILKEKVFEILKRK